jgi:hypothetical protein
MSEHSGVPATAQPAGRWGKSTNRTLRLIVGAIFALALLLFSIIKLEDWRQFRTDL